MITVRCLDDKALYLINNDNSIACIHAIGARSRNAVCSLSLFGGRPSRADCAECAHRVKPKGNGHLAYRLTQRQSKRFCSAKPIESGSGTSVKLTLPSNNIEPIVLRNHQSPGDIVALTAAVRDLQLSHPGKYFIQVDSLCGDLWRHNPHVNVVNGPEEYAEGSRVIRCEYPGIHSSNRRPHHFIQAFVENLEKQLGVGIEISAFKGDIHLSEEELLNPSPVLEHVGQKPFWIMIAGGKYDFTAKWWNPEHYQKVVDHFKERITFVQCGEAGHWHEPLRGTINMIGRTDLREFVRLMYHAEGVVSPVTFAMHAAAAVPTRDGNLRHCVVVAGGREPVHWEQYPGHQFLHTIGQLDCCRNGGCWKSRCQKVGDGDSKDNHDLCKRPVQIRKDLSIPECMNLIAPDDVVTAIERFTAVRKSASTVEQHESKPVVGAESNSTTAPKPSRGNPFYQQAFAVVADSNFYPGLMALLNSIHVYHGASIRTFVFVYHLTEAQVEEIREHPMGPAITLLQDVSVRRKPAGIWEAKQQVLDYLMGRAKVVCLLDADLVLLSKLGDVFNLAERGKIVSSRDGTDPIRFGREYRSFGEKLVGKEMPYFNSGFLCLDIVKHWDLVALWSFSSHFAAYSPNGGAPLRFQGHGDQGLLNAVAGLQDKESSLHLFTQDEWCNSGLWSANRKVVIEKREGKKLTVTNTVTGGRQRLLHSTGPKWWTTQGAEHFSKCGDVLECFKHFDNNGRVSSPAVKPGRKKVRMLIGVLSAKSGSERREACQSTWSKTKFDNIEILFLIGDESVSTPVQRDDILYLPCRDDYESLVQKVRWFTRWACDNRDFEYILKCDDDTFVVIDRLLMTPWSGDFIGYDMGDFASGGAGYLLSPHAAKIVSESIGDSDIGAEDVKVAASLKEAGIHLIHDEGFRPGHERFPTLFNNIVTNHYCNVAQMKRIKARLDRRKASTFGFMPIAYLVNRHRKFKAVCISKNACTSLKQLVIRDDFPDQSKKVGNVRQIHDFMGYSPNGKTLLSLESPDLSDYLRFAVYRDPIERAMSFYQDKFISPEITQNYLSHLGIIGCDLDTFIAFLEFELGKADPNCMDEHARPQALYYDPPVHIDKIVPIGALNSFLGDELGVKDLVQRNSSRKEQKEDFMLTKAQSEKIKQLYEIDYHLASTNQDLFWRS